MEKKTMYMAIGLVAVLIIAAIGASMLMGGSKDSSPSLKIVMLKKDSSSTAYSPLDSVAVYNNSYPLSRYLYLYTDGTPNGSVYQWIDFVLTQSKGQDLADQAGFYSLSSTDLAAMRAQLTGGSATGSGAAISQMGSDTMHELCQLWASNFKNETGIDVTITGGGSGLGIAQFVQGNVDVAQASRAMKDSEKTQAIANGINPVEFKVAIDGIAIVVNADNPVNTLTMEQLRGIYNGTYDNWNQVGGDNGPIVLYGRNSASGTYDYFKEVALLKGNYSSSMQQFSGNAQIVVQVEDAKGGIGYVGIGYAKEATADQTSMESFSSQLVAQIVRLED